MEPQRTTVRTARRSLEGYVDLTKRRTWYAGEEAAADATAEQTQTDTGAADKGKGTTDSKRTYTQAELDKMFGDRANQAKSAATAELLKRLGYEKPEDAEAALKLAGEALAEKKKREDDAKSKEDLLAEKLAEAEKKAEAAEQARLKLETERREEKRDNEIKAGFSDPKLRCKNPLKVFKLLKVDHPDEVAAVMKDDGTIDAAKVKALIELGKKEYQEDFGSTNPAIPSNNNGYNGDPDKDAQRRASQRNQQHLRG